MKRTLFLTAIVILLTALSFGYFYWVRPSQAEKSAANSNLKTAEKAQSTANLIAAPGIVEPISEEIEVGAEISGKLKQVAVEEGDEVKKGQIIAVLENADFEANISEAKAQIQTLFSQKETAKARLLQAETERERIKNGARNEERKEAKSEVEKTLPNIEQARREVERRQRLYDSGDLSREELERAKTAFENAEKQTNAMQAKFNVVNAPPRTDDLDKADAAIRLAETQIREFDAQINEAETRVRQAEANLTKTIVRAPIAGVVLRKRLKGGESVAPENPTGIITLADVSALRVRVGLDETDVAKIKEGQTAYVTADAFGNQKFTAKVVKIGQTLGRKNFRTERPTEKVDTKILEILLELAPHQKLPLGLRVDAFIATGN